MKEFDIEVSPYIFHIIDNYSIDDTFIITIGYYGSLVRDFLLLAYPKHHFIFVEVDNYQGPGSGPGYSLLCCLEFLQKPFYFHHCGGVTLLHKQREIPRIC